MLRAKYQQRIDNSKVPEVISEQNYELFKTKDLETYLKFYSSLKGKYKANLSKYPYLPKDFSDAESNQDIPLDKRAAFANAVINKMVTPPC